MKKVKIIYTIPNFDTCGSGLALIKLIQGLDKEKFAPSIVCLHDRGQLFHEVKKLNIPVYTFPYLTPIKPRYKLIVGVIKTALFFKSLKPDLIFSYDYSSNFSDALASKLINTNYLYVKKNMGWKGPSYNQWRLKTWLSKAITVQNTDMIKQFFPNIKKASIISIGVDTNDYYPRKKNQHLLHELNIDRDNKIILCVANIIPKKGIDHLLKGFAMSSTRNQATLLIVGDDSSQLGQELKDLKANLSLGEKVIFTGKRFDVPAFYSIADLFILPSTGNEGAPIAIQEAMASGVPVVTTNTPGNRDQLRELPDQLIPPMDEAAIALALDTFLNITDDERKHIIDLQHRIVEERYSLKEEVRKHEALYLSLVNSLK